MEINDLHNVFNTLIAICALVGTWVQVIFATPFDENLRENNFCLKKYSVFGYLGKFRSMPDFV